MCAVPRPRASECGGGTRSRESRHHRLRARLAFGTSDTVCYGLQMRGSLLEDAFAHHVWATLRLVDASLRLSPEQMETTVPGTYGSILETMRHLIGGDSWYLFDITGDRARRIDADRMDLLELRAAMEADGASWSAFLAQDLDPDAVLKEIDEDDGYERDATIGIRLAQALHHGTEHRSQICTALTTLGVQPPGIEVWDFGLEAGSVVEVSPTS
jgi:uncharacterized damage-inducible protein DinB